MKCHDVRLISIRIDHQLIGMAVYAHQALHADAQACLLPHLPLTGLGHRLARVHTPARQAPLTVIRAARKKDPPALIEDCSRAAKPEFSLPADPVTIKNLCHIDFPFSEAAQDYLVKQRKDRGYVTKCGICLEIHLRSGKIAIVPWLKLKMQPTFPCVLIVSRVCLIRPIKLW